MRPGATAVAAACSYCECFASGRYCDSCNCVNCCNNHEHETTRQAAVEGILERNPNAFRPKIQATVRTFPTCFAPMFGCDPADCYIC